MLVRNYQKYLGGKSVGSHHIGKGVGIVAFLAIAVPAPDHAKADSNVPLGVLGAFGNMVNQAQQQQRLEQQNQARQTAADAWSQSDPRIVSCLQNGYHLNVQTLVNQGIAPGDPRVSGYVTQCSASISTALARQQQEQERLKEEAAAREKARADAEARREKETEAAAAERAKAAQIAAAQQRARVRHALEILRFYSIAGKVAPSFDCAKASTSVEQLICSDQQLAEADRAMGEAFRVHPKDAVVVREQREWLKARDSACAIPSSLANVNPQQHTRLVDCLTTETTTRIAKISGTDAEMPDAQLRPAIIAYEKAYGMPEAGFLTTIQEAQLFQRARDQELTQERAAEAAKAEEKRQTDIASEKDKWQSFQAQNPSATKLVQGDTNDILALLDTGTSRYKSGQIILTLSGKIDASGQISVAVLGTAANVLKDRDGGTAITKALATYQARADQAKLHYVESPARLLDGSDIYIVTRGALSEFPFLGTIGIRDELIAALSSSRLVSIFAVQGNDIAAARAQRLAAEEEAKRRQEQQQAQAQKHADEMVQKSETIRAGIAAGKIADFALITIDGHTSAAVCASTPADIDVLDAFDELPSAIKTLPRKAPGDADHIFLEIRRGSCGALIGKGTDLQPVMAGLYRDQVAFSVFPQTVPLDLAAAKLTAIAKQKEAARERTDAERARLVKAQEAAAKADADLRKSQDALVPKCDDRVAIAALKDVFQHNAMSKLVSLRLLDVSDVTQLSFDPNRPERSCNALFALNTGEQRKQYRIWLSSDKTSPLVEVLP